MIFLILFAATFGQDLRTIAGEKLQAHEAAEAALADADAAAIAAAQAADVSAALARDARVAEQLAAEEAAVALQAWLDFLGGPPIGSERPGEDLDWGVLPRPTEEEIDWIAAEDTLMSTRGLGSTGSFGSAYRLSRAAGDEMPVFGIRGRVPMSASVGGSYGQYGAGELMYAGDTEASATFVGLTDDANIRLGWGSHFQNAQDTGEIRIYDLGLRGAPDGHLMNAAHGGRILQMDGCWYVHHDQDFDYDVQQWSWPHSVSIGDTDVLIIRNHKWRGEKPTDKGLRFLYYSVAYTHGQRTSFLFENNDLRGGGRGGMQNRPDAYGYGGVTNDTLPTARIMLKGNYHTSDGAGGDGGQCMGVWAALGGLYIYDNVLEDFPFTAVMTSGQNVNQNWPNPPSGNQMTNVYVAGNRFIPGPNTRRDTINLSSIDRLHLWGDNVFEGTCTLDAQWNYERNGTLNGLTSIHAQEVPGWNLRKYVPAEGWRAFTQEELEVMLTD